MDKALYTWKARRIWAAASKLTIDGVVPPTVREVAREANVSSTSVVCRWLRRLDEAGYIELSDKGAGRAIRVVVPLLEVRR